MSDLVEMSHPTLPGRPIKVGAQSVPHHEAAGWLRVAVEVETAVVDLAHSRRRRAQNVAGNGEHDDSGPAVVDDQEAGDKPAANANEGGASE